MIAERNGRSGVHVAIPCLCSCWDTSSNHAGGKCTVPEDGTVVLTPDKQTGLWGSNELGHSTNCVVAALNATRTSSLHLRETNKMAAMADHIKTLCVWIDEETTMFSEN